MRNEHNCDGAVEGAGPSGLTSAHLLAGQGEDVHVLEARDAAGGRVDGENATGAEFVGRPHTAPRSLFPIGAAMWRLRATALQLDASAPWRSAAAGELDAVKLATWLFGNGATKSGAAVGGFARSDSAPGPTQ